ncbi:hypothetical protein CDD83_1977 [Cordyceps sp. RAO-2017]|nr:hypothetical protein CDD83_1977 [Cordyceps sp. RAO-2017]
MEEAWARKRKGPRLHRSLPPPMPLLASMSASDALLLLLSDTLLLLLPDTALLLPDTLLLPVLSALPYLPSDDTLAPPLKTRSLVSCKTRDQTPDEGGT